ncbi:MAG: GerMN domain-containing protein [Bacilli bacterium]|nr:GerMN domain-containing protein [Bacilli bacterium]
MLKKTFIKKMTLSLAMVFAILLMYLIPNNSELQITSETKYIDTEITKSFIYLLDKNNFLARTSMPIDNKNKQKQALQLLQALIKEGEMESNIPNGFKSIIPNDTEIKSIEIENDLIKVNFSSNLLDVKQEYEEKIIEAIVYTLTSIENINKVIIYVEGNILSKLPKTGINLPSTLDRSFGINKKYDIKTYKDITSVNIYYISKYNDEIYYVPVTKYLNSKEDKIKIIIDELASFPIYNTNLMSYLNGNVNLLDSKLEEKNMHLVFNDYIFNDVNYKNILEEVIYTISLSVKDNYDIDQVIFEVNNEEIYKSVIKTIE